MKPQLNVPGRLGSSVKPAFGAGGAYVETVSRTTFFVTGCIVKAMPGRRISP
ncbi:hypothetical protein [Bradyrhizobium sp. SZCCHNS1054]|uniref:hypothetical protein n=1 Tax=Bradyrhizobium sp. SZCCHNS1054 TaxID=3057301 RepID=UPI00291641CC|nr:hypothetical protein [Bradyrhizobium sp. SZCCHNS1054]